jgi:small subunit ribosomal protein S3
MSGSEKSAVKSLLSMHRTYAELDEFLEAALKEAGYAGVEIQKNPVGTRLTVYVTRPGLAIGRRGTGIKDLTEQVGAKFGLPNPQIAVSEVESPELNPRIMAVRTAQIVARGTAFRRAATWTMNSIMAAGAAGVEIGVAGKLRSDRSHSEKYRMGVVPKSGEMATRVVRHATTDVLLKLGLYGIQVSIALKDAAPPAIEYVEQQQETKEAAPQQEAKQAPAPAQPEVPQQAPAGPEASAAPESTTAPQAKAPRKSRKPKQPKAAQGPTESAPAEASKEAEPAPAEVKVEEVAQSESKDS